MTVIDLGDVYPITVTLTDASGAPANAATVTLTITLPDGSTLTPGVANPPATAGLYSYDYATTQPGRHAWRITTTGPASAYTDVFDVADSAVGPIVGLSVVKKWLNMDLTRATDDDELRDLLDATTPIVEDVVGPVVVRQFTESHPLGDHGRHYNADTYSHGYYQPFHSRPRELVLGRTHVLTLVSVLPVLTGGTSYDVATLDVDLPTGIVRRLDGGTFRGPLRVTYTAGLPVIPGNILMGTKEIIRHAWETQRGHATARPGLGDEDLVQTPSGFLVPRRALEWLRPHDRGPVMA